MIQGLKLDGWFYFRTFLLAIIYNQTPSEKFKLKKEFKGSPFDYYFQILILTSSCSHWYRDYKYFSFFTIPMYHMNPVYSAKSIISFGTADFPRLDRWGGEKSKYCVNLFQTFFTFIKRVENFNNIRCEASLKIKILPHFSIHYNNGLQNWTPNVNFI